MTTTTGARSQRATFAVLASAVLAYSLLQSLVLPVLPTIQASLHTTQNTVTWVLTAYLLSASVFTPILGRLGDMFGKERMLVVALGTLAAHFVVPRSENRSPGRLSWPAIWLLSGWLISLLLAVSEAPAWGWVSDRVLGLFAVALVLAVAWVVVETRSGHPLIDMKMMRIPVVWTTNLVAFLLGIGMYSTFTFVPEYMQAPVSTGYGFGASVTRSGLVLLPMGAAMFAFSFMSGWLTSRFGSKLLLLTGSTVSIFTFVVLTWANGSEWELLIAMGLQGIGFGLAFAAMSSLIVEGVPEHQTGVASGMNANIRTIGGSIGGAVVSSIVVATLHGHRFAAKSGYTHGFFVLTITTLAAAVAAVLVPSVRRVLTLEERRGSLPHAELGILAAGTLLGTDPE